MNTTTRRFTTDMLNDPFFVGFDRLFDRMPSLPNSQEKYPPYNIIKTGEDDYVIELAVAGFAENDFDIELHNGILTISAAVSESEDTDYIHKGIAARNFVRTFTLADTIVVDGASLHMGLLTVRLKNVIPDEKKPRKITISSPEEKQLLTE